MSQASHPVLDCWLKLPATLMAWADREEDQLENVYILTINLLEWNNLLCLLTKQGSACTVPQFINRMLLCLQYGLFLGLNLPFFQSLFIQPDCSLLSGVLLGGRVLAVVLSMLGQAISYGSMTFISFSLSTRFSVPANESNNLDILQRNKRTWMSRRVIKNRERTIISKEDGIVFRTFNHKLK